MKITEIKGNSQVFTLNNSETLRLFARTTKEVPDNLISEEMRIAERMGLIIMQTSKTAEKTPVNDKKNGGTKNG